MFRRIRGAAAQPLNARPHARTRSWAVCSGSACPGTPGLRVRLVSADAVHVRTVLATVAATLAVALGCAPVAATPAETPLRNAQTARPATPGTWLLGAAAPVLAHSGGQRSPKSPPRVLLITAHPDDETLFNLGRFAERGWPTAVALVTNGEAGAVVQSIRTDYDPQRYPDVLVEAQPGNDAWLTTPPNGPRLRLIPTPTALAAQRRREFLAAQARNRVDKVYLLSTLSGADFDDNWDEGIRNWDKPRLRRELSQVTRGFKPDLLVTLNPGETWAHPQHVGLGRLVQKWHTSGRLRARLGLYGLREHAWYTQSLSRQRGDLRFDRSDYSQVLGATYEDHWRQATSAYISQSSHPVWLQARAEANILPGYRGLDVIRQLNAQRSLKTLLRRYPPDARAYRDLSRHPQVIHQ